jgi:pyruvate dehydrogenase E2 component (dihydrolipoamide acetyltransferase)
MVEVPLVMPKMSMTMTEGTFLVWHKAEGDQVRQGDIVCEVATDKVDMEVEATATGTLTRLLAAPDEVVPVGEPIAYIASDTDDLLGGLFDAPDLLAAVPQPPPPITVPAVPAARRLAAERGVDLTTITPTGPWQTIRLSDMDTVSRNGLKQRDSRSAVARRMSASAQIPQFVLYRDMDLETVPHEHGWTPVLVRAFATALRRTPELNASWIDGSVHRHEQIGVALAVDTGRGLLAPVLTDPDLQSPDVLPARITDVVARARTERLELAELSAPAATTVSNLGGFGVTRFQALVTPPQATVLSIGAIEPRVVPVPGGVGVRLRCTVGLTVDHRVADGAAAARLLATLQEVLSA